MTTLCGGGSSAPKSAALAEVAYTSGLIAELLAAADSPWLIPVIPLLTLPPVNLTSFCASDPPSMPTFTVAEAQALVLMNIGTSDWNSGATKVINMIENALWFQLCECTTTTTPTITPAPAPPSGVALPTFSYQPQVQPCNTFIYTTTTVVGGSLNLGGPVYRGLTPTSFTYTAKLQAAGTTGGSTGTMQFVQQTAANPTARTDTFSMNPGDVKTMTVPAVPGCGDILLEWNTTVANGGGYVTGSQIDAFCGDSGLPSQTSTCPPDPAVMAVLEQILSLLTIVQRQSVPFAYIPGTVHGPLHGSGEFNLSDIVLGLKIVVTGIDGTVGEQILDPIRLFEVGWISIGDADGFWCQKRIENASELYFPKFAGSATRVGWTTTSNASLTITELLRER